ncbi:MAG TPA: hypothetical protein PLQ30_02285 [Rectinema sp.]|nr:MAG: hypothetical protein BWX81_00945 [Spirochaetes bacterium ADurb.Bin110]HNV35526.1 hypothetical protein [Rectinema sp.]HPW01302.1 hypothetical protein [Rectinema sp.]HQN03051.1 hypothetical protein [Rectinema sp.]
MNWLVKIFAIVLVLCSILPFFAAASELVPEIMFQKLTQEETAMLKNGEPIIRSIRSSSDMLLVPFDKDSQMLIERAKKLNGNYITEFILALPLTRKGQGTMILDRLLKVIANVKGYVSIPYYSVRQQTTYDLFDKMDIISQTKFSEGESIVVLQHMEPFDDFRAEYRYAKIGNNLSFSGENLDSIIYSYRNLSVVAPHKMRWELYAFEKDGCLYAYGYGAVRAFDLFGLFRDRLEPSFMGRVSAFFKYIAEKMSLS